MVPAKIEKCCACACSVATALILMKKMRERYEREFVCVCGFEALRGRVSLSLNPTTTALKNMVFSHLHLFEVTTTEAACKQKKDN